MNSLRDFYSLHIYDKGRTTDLRQIKTVNVQSMFENSLNFFELQFGLPVDFTALKINQPYSLEPMLGMSFTYGAYYVTVLSCESLIALKAHYADLMLNLATVPPVTQNIHLIPMELK